MQSKGLSRVFSNTTVVCSNKPLGFPNSSVGKESACDAGYPGSIPGWGRSTGEGIDYPLQYSWASLVTQLIKNPPAMWETWVQFLGWEDPLEKEMATHSSSLAWKIPWTEERTYGLFWWLSSKESSCQCRTRGFYSRVRNIPQRRKWHFTPGFLLGKSHGQRSLVVTVQGVTNSQTLHSD